MSTKIKLGNSNWGVKENGLLAYNDEDGIFKAIEMNHSRSSTATRVNSAGLIEEAEIGVPRIDFQDDSNGALLLEPSRTNNLQRSEEFDNAYWNKSLISVTQNDGVSLDGSVTADKIVSGNSTGSHFFRRTGLTYAATDNTFSVFAKFTDDLFEQFHFVIYDGSNHFAYFDVKNGSVISADSGVTASMINYGNGWYRCIASYQTVSTSVGQIKVELGDSTSITGDGTSGMLFWGMQWETGSYATSYIPTSGATATRIVDTCSKSGLDNYINSSEGVLFVETKGFTDLQPSSTYMQLSKSGETGFNNSLTLQHRDNGTLRVYVNGTATANITFIEDIDFSQNHKIAVLYKLNGYKLFIDGVKKNLYLTPSQTVFSGLDSFSFDRRGSSQWNGKIKDLRVYDQALSDEELQNLTTL